MNKELENKLDEIIDYIKSTDSYKNYIYAKELLSNRKDLIKKIEEIKLYQKLIVNKSSKKKELEEKIKENLIYLENDITYISYKESLEDINNMLIIFENKINKYFDEVFY